MRSEICDPNFEGLVRDCLEVDFCKFVVSTHFSSFFTADLKIETLVHRSKLILSDFVELCINFVINLFQILQEFAENRFKFHVLVKLFVQFAGIRGNHR